MRQLLLLAILIIPGLLISQEKELEIEGGIKIGNVASDPEPGTIRWNGTDFEGYNGLIWISLTGNMEVGKVYDVDSNEYKTVRIGDQTWMAENLRTTRYRDSTLIGQETDPDVWKTLTEGAWCWFGNIVDYDIPYGKLYNLYAATSNNRICPEGWSVPSTSDWNKLGDYLGMHLIAGGKMKEEGFTHWSPPNIEASNETGFSGVGGGWRNGTTGDFENFHQSGCFWTDLFDYEGRYFFLATGNGELVSSSANRQAGLSVRCIKD